MRAKTNQSIGHRINKISVKGGQKDKERKTRQRRGNNTIFKYYFLELIIKRMKKDSN